ncbi:MAG: nucleotidyl transferase AbiEii/AbiGii toxin family protein [Elusimicrobia bacterium]|nr:nucleotidyl transferase AbiEii/AbiGii toxin family protein [Candidatus Obscuribacterium magneticum]
MDEIARFPAQDRADLFQTAASIRGDMRPALIEKDFWVCWTLQRLFTLDNSPAGLVFKGGTSLSKVYQAIDRFSEDMDLSFDRNALGFGGDKDPASAPTRSQSAKRLEKLSAACRGMIRTQFLPQLETTFGKALGVAPSTGTWRVEMDPDDPDQQTLPFHYPAGIAEREVSLPRYSRPTVRLELGARGEQWPAEWAPVTPYAAQAVPKPFTNPSCRVKALAAERTFWEKATILHMLYYLPSGKRLPERQSRHYYDLAKLYEKEPGKRAATDFSLLKSVTEHKSIFFASTAARYDLAVPSSLKLVPPSSRIKELENDYAKMREMIFGAPPPFEELMAVVGDIERRINGADAMKRG